MLKLNTQLLDATVNSGSYTPASTQSGYHYTPSPQVLAPKPVSYQFRVAEYEDENGEVGRVGLQYQTYEHDALGYPSMRSDWTDVPRVRIPFAKWTVV